MFFSFDLDYPTIDSSVIQGDISGYYREGHS